VARKSQRSLFYSTHSRGTLAKAADYEVVVVGAGIGGLTVAALLAARGVRVCLLERQSRVGGCVTNFEKFGYTFEPTDGLYGSWRPGEIHDRIFSELPVEAPEVRLLNPSYVVRLPDQSEVALTTSAEEFENNLRLVFPECAEGAIRFYRESEALGTTIANLLRRLPNLGTAATSKRILALLHEPRYAAKIIRSLKETAQDRLQGTSARFRRFIDLQLQTFAQASSEECAYLYACVALNQPRAGMFAIRGGAAALADRLAESVRKSGGIVRLDSPVLRLAYDGSGRALGVDLLSGETVTASCAIVSNMTVWDTYGKLVGLNRAPATIRRRLAMLRGWGAYLIYLGMNNATAETLPGEHVLALTHWPGEGAYDPQTCQFMLAGAPRWDPRGPQGKRAITIHGFTEADDWFTFHKDQTEDEAKDQSMLEAWWERLQRMLPELGEDIEVIETATPRTFYDLTRRKLGMVGGLRQTVDVFGLNSISGQTSIPNLFMVGDTTFPGGGIAGVSLGAFVVANQLTRQS